MSETKKIKKEELESIQTLVRQINSGQLQIGQLETQKHMLLHQIAEVQKGLKNLQDDLEKEYGKVNLNIEDGTITPIKKGEDE